MQSVLERDFLKPYVATDQVRKNGRPKPFRWTVREYYQMAELGFFRGKRVEGRRHASLRFILLCNFDESASL